MLLTIDEIHFLFCWFGILTLALINFGQIMPSSVWTALAKMMLYLKFLGARISYPEILWDSWTLRLRWWLQVTILFCSAGNRHWTGPWAEFWTECLTGSWPGFWTWIMSVDFSDKEVTFDIFKTSWVSTDFLLVAVRIELWTWFQKSVSFVCNGRATYFERFANFRKSYAV